MKTAVHKPAGTGAQVLSLLRGKALRRDPRPAGEPGRKVKQPIGFGVGADCAPKGQWHLPGTAMETAAGPRPCQ